MQPKRMRRECARGGGLFACPGGIAQGEFIGQRLFEALL
jgi:hypothetical protein